MARRKGGFGILLFVTIFLGILAAGAAAGLVSFYTKYDNLLNSEVEGLPKWKADLEAAKKVEEKAIARWNDLAPVVLDAKIQKPEDFDASEGKKEVDTQVVDLISSHLGRADWGQDPEVRREFVRKEKLRVGDVVKKQDERIATLEDQVKAISKTNEELNQLLAAERPARQSQEKTLQDRIEALTVECSNARQQVETVQRTLTARENELNQKLKAEQNNANRLLAAKDREITDAKNETQRLRDEKIALTQNREVKGVVLEPKGEITGVAQSLGLAYVNLGRHQRLQRGMRFTVFSMGRGGVPRVKGEIEVRNVGDDTSKAGVLSQVSERDPIVVGDLIANPAYRPDAKPTFVLCGEMQRYSHEDMVRLIEENGGKVLSKVTPDTDFVVAGGDVSKYAGDSASNYRDALQLGLRMMNEKELLQYLPYYGEK